MLYEFDGNYPDSIRYWSNSAAELFNSDGDPINEYDLPHELVRALNDLWSDNRSTRRYLVQVDGKYGVAIEAEYDTVYADDLSVSLDSLMEFAQGFARMTADRYADYDVFFCKHVDIYGDDGEECITTLVLPWDIDYVDFIKVVEWFDDNCYIRP